MPRPDLSPMCGGPFQKHVKLLVQIDELLRLLDSDELTREAKELGGGYARTIEKCGYINCLIKGLIAEQMMPYYNDANRHFLARAAVQLAATEGDPEAQREGLNPELDAALRRIRQTMLPLMGRDFLQKSEAEKEEIAMATWEKYKPRAGVGA